MSSLSLGGKARQLLPPVAIAVIAIAIRETFGLELPAWSYWITVVIFTILGGVALASPDDVPRMRAPFARAIGITFLIAAAYLAYSLLTSQFPFK